MSKGLMRVAVFACSVQIILFFQWQAILRFEGLNSSCDESFRAIKAPPTEHLQLQQEHRGTNKHSLLSDSLFALKTQNKTAVNELARPFSKWKRPFPCFPAEQDWNTIPALRRPLKKGFMYFKARKAGSSTIAGITLRIAQSMAAQTPNINTTICNARFGHPPAWYNEYFKRDKLNSFLWTIIREPTKRHVSEFFHFRVSRDKWEPTDFNMKWHFQESANDIDNYYLYFMKTDRAFDREKDNIHDAVQSIMKEYNFIGILERLDESLVVLQMLLSLKTSDILYLKSKVNGGFDDGVAYNGTCFYIVKSYISPTMKKWFETSSSWHNYTRGDNLLYATAHQSLDLTIDHLGRKEFELLLNRFKHSLQIASETCTDIRYPCSDGGVKNSSEDVTDRLWSDLGCGFACLDRVAMQLGI
jgi:hypothetical protein